MTRPAVRWRAVVCGVAIALGVTACTTSSADGPSSSLNGTTPSASVVDPSSTTSGATASTPPVSPTPSVIDVPTPSSAPLTSLDPVAQEASDRAAIEAQWVKFWQVYNGIVRTPADQRSAVLDAVAVDPVKSEMLDAAMRFESQGIDYFGSVTQHPYWVTPVSGQSIAVMRDCQDQSLTGTIWLATGEVRTSGGDRNSLQAGFVRGGDGIWRVQQFNHLENVPC